jgi:hypothetical protein
VVAGNIGSWPENGQQLLGYWVGREWWGRGVATQALALLVDEMSIRPLYAHVAVHNVGSIRVLEKCGFRRDPGQEAKAPASDDGIQELIFVLNAKGQRSPAPGEPRSTSNALASARGVVSLWRVMDIAERVEAYLASQSEPKQRDLRQLHTHLLAESSVYAS